MSYAAQPPVTASPAGSRPAAVTTAVALLWTMAVAGLAYATSIVAIAPATVSRFRDATGGGEQAEAFVTVIWLDAAVAVALAILVVALFAVLGLGLRRGSRLARGVTIGMCALGVAGGFGSLATVGVQRSGEALAGSVGEALGNAYPNGWIVLNVAVAGAQILAYLVVGGLLLAAPRQFFGGEPAAQPGFASSHPAVPSSGAGWPSPGAGWPGAPSTGAVWPPAPSSGGAWPVAPSPGTGSPVPPPAGAGWPVAPSSGAGWPVAPSSGAAWPVAPSSGAAWPPAGQPSGAGFPGYGPSPAFPGQAPGAYPPPGHGAPTGWGPPPAQPAYGPPSPSGYPISDSAYAPPPVPVPPASNSPAVGDIPETRPPASPTPATSDSTPAPLNRNESSVTTPISDPAPHPEQKTSEPDQSSSPPPPAGPEDEYWSRPSDSEPRADR